MFQQQQLEEHAFPVLYPKGKFGIGYDRNKPIMTSRTFNPDYSIKTPGGEIMWHVLRKLQNEISIMSRIKKKEQSAPNSR